MCILCISQYIYIYIPPLLFWFLFLPFSRSFCYIPRRKPRHTDTEQRTNRTESWIQGSRPANRGKKPLTPQLPSHQTCKVFHSSLSSSASNSRLRFAFCVFLSFFSSFSLLSLLPPPEILPKGLCTVLHFDPLPSNHLLRFKIYVFLFVFIAYLAHTPCLL